MTELVWMCIALTTFAVGFTTFTAFIVGRHVGRRELRKETIEVLHELKRINNDMGGRK